MSYLPFHLKRVDAQDIGPGAPTDLAIWLFLQLASGHILLPLLVATFLFSSSVLRHPTVISVCCTWIISGIVSCLLFYSGHHVGPEPPKGLCIAQAALIVPVPPMASMAVLSLVYYAWSAFRPSKFRVGEKVHSSRLVTICLVAAPYITYLGFAVGALMFSLQHPDRVNRSRRFFYCTIDWDLFNDTMALFTAAICLLTTALEAHLVFTLTRSWTALRRAGLSAKVDLQLVVRVAIFTIYILAATAIMFAMLADTKSAFPDMFAASIGLALFIVFATQPDVLRVWSTILLHPWHRRTARTTRTFERMPDLPPRIPTPVPDFDFALLERTDSELGEKARLAALHAYYKARVQELGVGVEVIKRPEDAFVGGRQAWRTSRWPWGGGRRGDGDGGVALEKGAGGP